MKTKAISNRDEIIDSRNVIARIEELREVLDGLDDEERAELAALEALAAECDDYSSDWRYGEVLIRDSHFTEYYQQFAEDIDANPQDKPWPAYCIDWERAARELKMDYSAVEFDGVTYWVRG